MRRNWSSSGRKWRGSGKGGSGPFPETLSAFAVRYLAHCLEKGDTVQAVVERLGVSGPKLQAWVRQKAKYRKCEFTVWAGSIWLDTRPAI